jgi:myo-inositol-1(or 4)-monophosphatase
LLPERKRSAIGGRGSAYAQQVMELTEEQVTAVTAMVTEAGREALSWFRPTNRGSVAARSSAALAVDNKRAGTGGFDPVTEADRSVERIVRDALAAMFPDDAITGEEFGTSGSGRRQWFIDPIDGTRAFVTGRPMWGTLVGLTVDGVPVAGWMHLPVLNETYVGVGHRAFMVFGGSGAGSRETVDIRTATTRDLSEAVVLSTHPSMFAPGVEAERFGELSGEVKMVCFGGDCMNYGVLATGDADLVVENQLASYDIIPLIPIITGAGGVVTDLDGNLPTGGGYVVAAATVDLHRAALDVLTS